MKIEKCSVIDIPINIPSLSDKMEEIWKLLLDGSAVHVTLEPEKDDIGLDTKQLIHLIRKKFYLEYLRAKNGKKDSHRILNGHLNIHNNATNTEFWAVLIEKSSFKEKE